MSPAVERVAEKLDSPLLAVNNAGIIRDNLLLKMSEPDWDAVMDVHLRGAFLVSRAAQQHMTAAGWGRERTRCAARDGRRISADGHAFRIESRRELA